jgi:hypothetical protein
MKQITEQQRLRLQALPIPSKSSTFWASWIIAGAVVDVYCLRKGLYKHTLTHKGRIWTGVHPEAGPRQKWAARAGWIAAAAWTVNHFAFGPHEDGRVHRFVVDFFAERPVEWDA